jgi:hypothetical protein
MVNPSWAMDIGEGIPDAEIIPSVGLVFFQGVKLRHLALPPCNGQPSFVIHVKHVHAQITVNTYRFE